MNRILCALCFAGAVLAQDMRPTLPEEAQRQAQRYGPKPVYLTRTVEPVFESLDSVMAQTDLALLGRVVQINAHLSADQKDIFTDYSIQPLRVIWPHPKAAPLPTRPGIQPQVNPFIVVERWGGTMTFAGVSLTQQDSEMRAFRQGEEVILFLKYDQDKKKYVPVAPASTTFYLDENRIRPFLRDADNYPVFKSVRGLRIDELDAEVNRRR
jgi:hypothetical protein